MFLCPNCLGPAITRQTLNKIENGGQVVTRLRYCKRCDLRLETREEMVNTTYYVRRVRSEEKDND